MLQDIMFRIDDVTGGGWLVAKMDGYGGSI